MKESDTVYHFSCFNHFENKTFPYFLLSFICFNNLGCVCFWGKWFQEIIFPQTQVFGNNSKFYFLKNGFLLIEIFTFDPEMILHPHFHFKSFSEKYREREGRESPDRRERERERERRESPNQRAPIVDCAARRSTCGAIVRWVRSSIDKRRDRRAVRSSSESARRSSSLVAIDRDRRRDRTARRSMSGAIVAARRSARSRSTAGTIGERCDRAVNRDLDNRGAIAPSFFWVCLFLLLLQTPENIFQKIF